MRRPSRGPLVHQATLNRSRIGRDLRPANPSETKPVRNPQTGTADCVDWRKPEPPQDTK